ncbi:MAG: zf-HC2 domain-containing protein [Clostridiales bacterium]|nr:zf-HC2 domain-containing protein [Clostridiales bacterium]
MKLSCDVMDDLLPLYADGACSQETAALVEAHLAACPRCRARLEQMREPAPSEEAARQRQEEAALLETQTARVRRKTRLIGLASAALVLLLVLLVSGIYLLWHEYVYDPWYAVPTSAIEIQEAGEDGDGLICFTLEVTEEGLLNCGWGTSIYDDEPGVCYLSLTTTDEAAEDELWRGYWGTFSSEELFRRDDATSLSQYQSLSKIVYRDDDGNELVIYDRDAQ